MTFQEQFQSYLSTRFPLWKKPEFSSAQLAPVLISPYKLPLPRSVWTSIEKAAQAFNELTELPSYQKHLTGPEIAQFRPGNRSILMSFDCHLTANFEPRLIEINTNASFGLISEALYDFHRLPHPNFSTQLKRAIETELNLSGITDAPRIAIVDSNPEQQKLYVEFIFYKNLFESWGFEATICDTSELQFDGKTLRAPGGQPINFVYNRDTDFYLAQNPHSALKAAYLARAACVSPNPHEYNQMADKRCLSLVSRLVNLPDIPDHLKATLQSVVPQTLDLSEFSDRDELWAQRKRYFFKPKNAYGSKAAYRGGSISRKTFNEVVTDEFVAQEFIPAREATVQDTQGHSEVFKYDLRFYAYQSEVHLGVARLYRGQVTNFFEPNGGFAPIEWQD